MQLNKIMILVWVLIAVQLAKSQREVFMVGNQNTTKLAMYSNNTYNSTFILEDQQFVCSNHQLYTYQQNSTQYQLNSIYYLEITDVVQEINISVNTLIHFIDPIISPTTCANGTTCTIEVRNGCPGQISYFNNFDVVYLTVGNLKTFVYNVICDDSHPIGTLEWGLLIEVGISVIIIGITARYENTGSFTNFGFQTNYIFMIVLSCIALTAIFLMAFEVIIDVISWFLVVVSWFLGTIGIALCLVEVFYATTIKCFRFYCRALGLRVRIMDVIGFLVGFGICFVWYYTDKNWIVSDFIFFCIWISGIKLFKFTNLKVITFTLFVMIGVSLIVLVVVEIALGISYNSNLFNHFNSPLFLQIPTISHVPNQKCSWIFISALVFAGMFASYLYRYDKSRQSSVYYTMFMIGYTIGSIIWVIINIVTPIVVPFGIISEPILLLIIILFSNRRNQLGTIWTGQFLDEDFRDNEQKISQVIQIVKVEKTQSKITFKQSLLRGLRLHTDLASTIVTK